MSRVACHTRKFLLRCLMASAAIVALHAPADAQIGSARYSSIVVDASSGDVLEAINPDQPRHPASLTKMMTLYMAFEALRDRRISLDTLVPVSPHAASMEPTKLGLVPGTHLTVEQAILGMITRSANDAASAMGELLGGTEDRFSQMMTLRARALGMSHTVFVNASGLPDPAQISTARDLAVLSRRLITDFPGYYRYFSTPSFVWHRQVIFNHDTMLKMYPGADGLKTGYTEASGHNLVTSAVRGGVRLIGVVLGAATNGERDIHMAALLDHGFEEEDVPVLRRAPPLATPNTRV
jgi:D-alanyl-D-alanine carboxypeptidase